MKAGILASSVMVSTGPWTPASLTGLVMWFDASDSSTITHITGAVTQWRDKSGLTRHLDDGAVSTRRPVTGTRTINSLNALDFNGTSHWLSYPTIFTVAQPITIATVVQSDAAPATVRIIGRSTATTFNLGRATTQWSYNAGTSRTGGTPDTNPHALTGVFDAVTAGLYLDNVAINSTSPGTNGLGVSAVEVGGRSTGSWWDGLIAEIIVTSTNLIGTADMTNLASYLKTKWGTP